MKRIYLEIIRLEKWEVFESIVHMPEVVKLVEYKWVFVRKCDEKNEIMEYKVTHSSRFLIEAYC